MLTLKQQLKFKRILNITMGSFIGRESDYKNMKMQTKENKSQITCQETNCNLKGYWFETLPNGNRVVCFKARHHQEWHVVRLELPEGVDELQKSTKSLN
jgi:hypothetical protein